MIEVHQQDALEFLNNLDRKVDLIYIDPPFNTGKIQSNRNQITRADNAKGTLLRYHDSRADYHGWLVQVMQACKNVLKPNGQFMLHLDYREVHYAKVMADEIFGYDNFMNEIIWSYDYGGRPKGRWATKHDNILWYVMDPSNYTFDLDASDRIPYMAPGLVGAEKAERGKTPTDVWWNTIVPTQGPERTGYPTQKPLSILRRIVAVHTKRGDTVLDCFAGSGTTGVAALTEGRNAILVDENPQAIDVIKRRLERL